MSANLVLALLCTVLLAGYCSGTPPEKFKYRRPLMQYLLHEYNIMNWKVIDYGKSVLQAYENEINTSMNTSSVEVQQFLGRILLTKANIEEALQPTSLFQLSLLQDSVLRLVKPNSKMPERLYKDFDAIENTIKDYKTEYWKIFSASVRGYFAQLSAPRHGRESIFVDWFKDLEKIEAVDSKLKKIHLYFSAGFQIKPQKFSGRHELNEYVLEEYERFFLETKIRTYHQYLIDCHREAHQYAEQYDDPSLQIATMIPSDVLSNTKFADSISDKYLRLCESRYDFYTLLQWSDKIKIALEKEGIDWYKQSCQNFAYFKTEAIEKLQILINAVSAAFDNYFEYENTDEFLSSPSFIWFERFDELSGWEALDAIEDYLAGIGNYPTS